MHCKARVGPLEGIHIILCASLHTQDTPDSSTQAASATPWGGEVCANSSVPTRASGHAAKDPTPHVAVGASAVELRPPESVFAANSVAPQRPRCPQASDRAALNAGVPCGSYHQLEAQCSRAEGDRLSTAVGVASSGASAAPKHRGIAGRDPGLPSAEPSIASSGEGHADSGLSAPVLFQMQAQMLSVSGFPGAVSGHIPGASSALSAVLPRLGCAVPADQDDYDTPE